MAVIVTPLRLRSSSVTPVLTAKDDQMLRRENGLLEFSEELNGIADVGFLLLAGDFALDGQGAAVADVFEGVDKIGEVDFALAEGHFRAPGLPRLIGPVGVLAVNALDVTGNLSQRRQRLAGAVQDHVRGIEIHGEVVSADVLDECQKPVRRFLPGLEVKSLPVFRAVIADLPCDVHQFPVEIARSVFGDEANVHAEGEMQCQSEIAKSQYPQQQELAQMHCRRSVGRPNVIEKKCQKGFSAIPTTHFLIKPYLVRSRSSS